MKKIALVLLSLVFILCAVHPAQAQSHPGNYGYSSQLSPEKIFYDDFSAFSNYWLLGIEEESWIENIENGQLYFQSLTDKPKEDLLPVMIDTERDFEIETSIKFVGGDLSKGYGLQWGKSKNPQKQFDFLLTGNGHYTIDKYTGEFHDYVPFTQSTMVNSYAANKLTVRKVDSLYYFFLNEQLAHSMPFEDFYGNLMGVQVAENSTILVDYFKVTYLDEVEKEQSTVLIMDYSLSSEGDLVKRGLPVTLTLNLKNVGAVKAEDMKISYHMPENVSVVDFADIQALEPGQEELITLQFYAGKDYQKDEILVNFDIAGVGQTNASDIDFKIGLDKISTHTPDKNLVQTYSEYRGGNDPLKGLNITAAMKSVQIGDYYALVIGIDSYTGEWGALQNAVNDAKGVVSLLREQYSFQYIKTLYDEEATRSNILSAFEWMMENVDETDNLLIFYSGHGEYNQDMGKGFWVPVDATTNALHNYISNEDIKSLLTGIRSKHTLLVADACFSGDIFRGKTMTIPYENSTKYYHKVYSLNSRKALTSGGLEPVMDAGIDGHSVFTYYFLKSLSSNEGTFYDAEQLFNSLKIPVANNSDQTPGYSPVKNTGDEGGQFIFIRKED